MLARFAHAIARHWILVLVVWGATVGVTWSLAPRWDDVTYDGDLAYMPGSMVSVRAERMLERAFPGRRSQSEMVVLASRPDRPLTRRDQHLIDQLAARLHNLLGVARYRQAERLTKQMVHHLRRGENRDADRLFVAADRWQRLANEAWNQALELNPQLSDALSNRALFYQSLGSSELAEQDRRLASDFAQGVFSIEPQLRPTEVGELPILDVWTRDTEVVGTKLRSRDRQAELVVLRLSQEFMATDNIRVLERLESELDAVRSTDNYPPGLQLYLTGSAAVGGDMLRSAAESIQNTELYTVLMVLGILVVVYRAPLLVAIPLITIVVSIVVATGLIAALTQLHLVPGFDWWNFKIFTTTRIFVVVILFGAGTDFCLFLIARYKEELDGGAKGNEAVGRSLQGVGSALAASAFTTIAGLATMFFAEFGKFRNSGPAIGLCLLVTLAACLTLAPALLSAFGGSVFWPFATGGSAGERKPSRLHELWDRLARGIVAHPIGVLVLSIAVLIPLAVVGSQVDVTYDFLSELAPSRPSRMGAEKMREHFPVGESGPLVVLAYLPGGDLDSADGKTALNKLTEDLYVPGVHSVRSLSEPRGERPSGFSLKKAALQSHELTRSLYLSKRRELGGDVARLDVLLEDDPFSVGAIQTLDRIDLLLQRQTLAESSYWHGADFLFAGTTAGIRDLREVTRADNVRIQVLVVLAVLFVLLAILQRPIVCVYLILSVLLTYYVTIGLTELYFQFAYGDTFNGLDWKVPLFLFVILVAVGQDYNIYLVTRVFEEQATHGLFGGLRRAIVRTGGIITSCGVIMAGAFVSMTTGSLRGMVELGFALSLGVLLDTFVVRPVLVPAFLAILFRFTAAGPARHVPVRPPHRPRVRRSSLRS
jgi:RND superfamily putative drug exporter